MAARCDALVFLLGSLLLTPPRALITHSGASPPSRTACLDSTPFSLRELLAFYPPQSFAPLHELWAPPPDATRTVRQQRSGQGKPGAEHSRTY